MRGKNKSAMCVSDKDADDKRGMTMMKTKKGDKNTPMMGSKVDNEAKEKTAKAGGGAIGGSTPRAHGGRVARKSGGGCESNPFSSAAGAR